MVKNPLANTGDVDSIPGSGRSPGEEMVTYSNILAWKSHVQRSLRATVHGLAKRSEVTQ